MSGTQALLAHWWNRRCTHWIASDTHPFLGQGPVRPTFDISNPPAWTPACFTPLRLRCYISGSSLSHLVPSRQLQQLQLTPCSACRPFTTSASGSSRHRRNPSHRLQPGPALSQCPTCSPECKSTRSRSLPLLFYLSFISSSSFYISLFSKVIVQTPYTLEMRGTSYGCQPRYRQDPDLV